MKLYSSVSHDTLKYSLLKGTVLGGTGALLLALGSIFLSSTQLGSWGIYIWGVGLSLIAWGLIPYQYLQRLTKKPNIIELDEADHFHYYSSGKLRLQLPLREIERVEFYEKGREYGLSITAGLKVYSLPYFSHRSYEKFIDAVR